MLFIGRLSSFLWLRIMIACDLKVCSLLRGFHIESNYSVFLLEVLLCSYTVIKIHTLHSLPTSDISKSDSSASVAALGGVLGVLIVTATVVQAMVIVFFIRKLQRAAKGNDYEPTSKAALFSFYAASTNIGVEMPTLSGKKYL